MYVRFVCKITKNRKLKTLFSYVFVFLFYILRHDIYFTMVVILVEELGHVVLATGNIQLGWVWPVIAHMAKWLPSLGEAWKIKFL